MEIENQNFDLAKFELLKAYSTNREFFSAMSKGLAILFFVMFLQIQSLSMKGYTGGFFVFLNKYYLLITAGVLIFALILIPGYIGSRQTIRIYKEGIYASDSSNRGRKKGNRGDIFIRWSDVSRILVVNYPRTVLSIYGKGDDDYIEVPDGLSRYADEIRSFVDEYISGDAVDIVDFSKPNHPAVIFCRSDSMFKIKRILPFMVYMLFFSPIYVITGMDNLPVFMLGIVLWVLVLVAVILYLQLSGKLEDRYQAYDEGLVGHSNGTSWMYEWKGIESVWKLKPGVYLVNPIYEDSTPLKFFTGPDEEEAFESLVKSKTKLTGPGWQPLG